MGSRQYSIIYHLESGARSEHPTHHSLARACRIAKDAIATNDKIVRARIVDWMDGHERRAYVRFLADGKAVCVSDVP